MQPPRYLALCGASSKGLMHLVVPLGICTTTATKLTCKKYGTGIHKFPKSYIPSPGFPMFCRPANYYNCWNISKYTIGKAFLVVKRLTNVCKGKFFLRRLLKTGRSWASFVWFLSTTVYMFVRCVLFKNDWLLKYRYVHLSNSCLPQVLE